MCLQALTDKLKGMASEVVMATTRHGDLHLQVHTSGEHWVAECGSGSPWYLGQQQCMHLRSISGAQRAGGGGFHRQKLYSVSCAPTASGVDFGTEIRGLAVLPSSAADGLQLLR